MSDTTGSADDRPSLVRRVGSGVFTLLVVAFAVYFWPANLGGATRIVTVSGHSMEPTYDLGDIVITRDTGDTEIGDVVVFEVPSGSGSGLLVIHRVVAVDEAGRFITQGDNRITPDDWPLTERDIVGEPLLHIPHAGIVLGWFQHLWVIATAAGVAVAVLLWPSSRRDESAAAAVDVGVDAGSDIEFVDAGSGDTEFSDAVMAEAIAWLDAELASAGQPSSS